MLGELAAIHAVVREAFAEASEGAGVDLWTLSQDGPEEQLNRTEFTQPALLAAGVAVWRAWQKQGGAQPSVLAGHSLGEYTALVAAGTLSLREGARLVRLRGQLMQDAAPAGPAPWPPCLAPRMNSCSRCARPPPAKKSSCPQTSIHRAIS
jgi:[acyl-carrier-protein] S-malonyltransferase